MAGCPLLYSADLYFTAKIRMPFVMNFRHLPDMGRMNGALLSAENRGCSPAPSAERIAPRSCTR